MAWKEVLVMEERIGFVLLATKHQQSFSSLRLPKFGFNGCFPAGSLALRLAPLRACVRALGRLFGLFLRNEAGKIAVYSRNHVYIDTPTACSGEVHSTANAWVE